MPSSKLDYLSKYADVPSSSNKSSNKPSNKSSNKAPNKSKKDKKDKKQKKDEKKKEKKEKKSKRDKHDKRGKHNNTHGLSSGLFKSSKSKSKSSAMMLRDSDEDGSYAGKRSDSSADGYSDDEDRPVVVESEELAGHAISSSSPLSGKKSGGMMYAQKQSRGSWETEGRSDDGSKSGSDASGASDASDHDDGSSREMSEKQQKQKQKNEASKRRRYDSSDGGGGSDSGSNMQRRRYDSDDDGSNNNSNGGDNDSNNNDDDDDANRSPSPVRSANKKRGQQRRRYDSDDDNGDSSDGGSNSNDGDARDRARRYDSDDDSDGKGSNGGSRSPSPVQSHKTQQQRRRYDSSDDDGDSGGDDHDDGDGNKDPRKRMESGHLAGLQNAQDFTKAEVNLQKSKHRDAQHMVDKYGMGETVYRDEQGRKTQLPDGGSNGDGGGAHQKQIQKQQQKLSKEQQQMLNTGRVQAARDRAAAQEFANLQDSSFARRVDDGELEDYRKSVIHKDDPMAAYEMEMRQTREMKRLKKEVKREKKEKKRMKKEGKKNRKRGGGGGGGGSGDEDSDDGGSSSGSGSGSGEKRTQSMDVDGEAAKRLAMMTRPVYKGPPPKANRFGIRPGYRWDGTDRGNGFEDKLLGQSYSRQHKKEMAYRYTSAGM